MSLSDLGELVLDLVNTVDVEEGTDNLRTPEDLARWVATRELPGGAGTEPLDVVADDLRLAIDLRDGLREVLGASVSVDPDPRAVDRANSALRRLPLHTVIGSPAPGGAPPVPLVAEPAASPARRALAAVAVAWTQLVILGESTRLKRCPESTCGWCFWDSTKARNRRWCAMRVCGNRAKTRAYAARRRA
jgi:predicted RNA-binding Zn ribbon-like protein